MGLTFFINLCLFAFLLGQRNALTPSQRRRWNLIAWAAMGLAVLSKGLIGVALPALALGAYVTAQHDVSVLRRLNLVPGLALMLLICAPWFVDMCMGIDNTRHHHKTPSKKK